MKFEVQELAIIQQVLEGATVKGKDARVVADLIDKVGSEIQKYIDKAEKEKK